MRRNIICALLALFLALSLTACGKRKQQPEPTVTPAATAAPTPTPTPVADVIPKPALTAAPTPMLTPMPTRSPAPAPTQTTAPTPVLTPIPTRSPAPAAEATPRPLATATPRPLAVSEEDTAAVTPQAINTALSNAPVITKQPNGEGHYVGESAVFITGASNWTSLHWTAVSPSGREIDMKTFRQTFPDCTVIGEQDTTLTVTNLNIDMSGWSFYCTFENEGAQTRTESARLRVRDSESTTSGSTSSGTGSGTAVATKSKRLHCPGCGSEVPRDLLNCPYCGAEIYTANELAYVNQDDSGDIFYMDNTGVMYYNSSDRISTYMDTNTNYTVFNDSGLVQSGNYNKEQEKAREEALLQSILSGDVDALF